MNLPEDILALIEKYNAGSLTPGEHNRLNEWYHSFNDHEIEILVSESETRQQLSDRMKDRLLENIRHGHQVEKAGRHRKWQMYAAAAAVMLMLFSTGMYFLFSSKSQTQAIVNSRIAKPEPVNKIIHGGNKAVLTLADGSSIVLDTATNGTIIQQGNSKVQKLSNGLLAYIVDGKQLTQKDEAFYNTITTPRGGQYHVTLADGTAVWLNAASSIRFPVVFTGSERKVEITGEAYFEVATLSAKAGKKMPFKVKAGLSEIEVLGTHFNVNAYNDEPTVKTTLLEGKVKVYVPGSTGNESPQFLTPGQQAGINKEGKIKVKEIASMDEVIAWKNGSFQFTSADLNSILRQIARWYNVEIEYKENVNFHFTGQLARNEDVSNVLEKLALTEQVHFKIEGKRIIVSR